MTKSRNPVSEKIPLIGSSVNKELEFSATLHLRLPHRCRWVLPLGSSSRASWSPRLPVVFPPAWGLLSPSSAPLPETLTADRPLGRVLYERVLRPPGYLGWVGYR